MRTVPTSAARIGWLSIGLILCGATVAPGAAGTALKKPGELIVRVIGPDGRPNRDADVRLFQFDRDWRTWTPADDAAGEVVGDRVCFHGLEVDAYLLVARAGGGLLAVKQITLLDTAPLQEVDAALAEPVAATLRVREADGRPIAGARFGTIVHTGTNGEVYLPIDSFKSVGLDSASSDADGVLRLPPLPAGRADIKVMHADYAPASIKSLSIEAGAAADVTLERGVKVTLRIRPTTEDQHVPRLMLDLRRHGDSPSVLIGHHLECDEQGVGRLTIAEGEYYWLRLQHPDMYVTPVYQYKRGKPDQYFRIAAGSASFSFDLKPKVVVRGRIVDDSTGRPISQGDVGSSVASTGAGGPLAEFAEAWTPGEWGETDDDGRFELKVAPGRARIEPNVDFYTCGEEYVETDVAADGSTVVPDIRLKPIPKLRGIVMTSDGRPVEGVVVKFASWRLYFAPPVLTDAEGRFEMAPILIPADLETREPLNLQSVVAFHPYDPLAARVEVRIDDAQSAGHIELRLVPQPAAELLEDLKPLMSPWEQGEMTDDERASLVKSMVGQPAPELDGAAWLNTDKPAMSLAEFRGKYVLLDFWTTWCGPCHLDFPTVRLLHRLYHDRGLVVVGVHDNSMPIEAVRADADKEKLTFPHVVDHADGRLVASYKIESWPSYVLIGPDGTIVRDKWSLGPTLRTRKLELIRELLMGATSASR